MLAGEHELEFAFVAAICDALPPESLPAAPAVTVWLEIDGRQITPPAKPQECGVASEAHRLIRGQLKSIWR